MRDSRLAAAVACLQPRWSKTAACSGTDGPDIDALRPLSPISGARRRSFGRPDLVRTLHEYDIADKRCAQNSRARWPEFHLVPGYAWDKGGVRENQLNETLHDNEIGLSHRTARCFIATKTDR